MMVDHEFINNYVTRIEQITHQRGTATNGDRAQLLRRLRDLAIRLDAIVELHLAKEERIYLPLIEEHVDEARQRNVLEAIHGSHEEEKKMSEARPLDVRNLVPRERHTRIFDTYTGLKAGEGFILSNDHDPRPRYYHFPAEHTGEF
jgi:iron-sulfur cluster repair protein YtfE (RIC family)